MSQKKCHKKNDLELFVRLHSDAQRQILAFIQTLVFGWANAEEVLQETNVTIWKKREDFDLDTNFMHWANRIAYYKVLKFRENSTKNHILSNETIKHVASDLFEMKDSINQEIEALECCIAKLSEKDRKLMQQRYFEEATVQAISDMLGRSARSVYASLKRIRNSLRVCILRNLALEGQES